MVNRSNEGQGDKIEQMWLAQWSTGQTKGNSFNALNDYRCRWSIFDDVLLTNVEWRSSTGQFRRNLLEMRSFPLDVKANHHDVMSAQV